MSPCQMNQLTNPASSASAKRLALNKVSLTYRNGVKALDQVSLELGNGMFGLLGPNGAGKSSLMRTIAALQQPDSGQICFDGVDVLGQPARLKSKLGYLPQEFGVYPKVSAYRLLDHIAVLKGILNTSERKEQVNALLEQVNLFQHRKKAVHTFSGGMKQRFGIAQALLGDPQLIITDEPTAGLDPEERHRFHNLLSEIASEKVVILSTHIVADVRELCPEMAIMANGRILRTGVPNQLIRELEGKVWEKAVSPAEIADLEKNFTVLSKRYISGKPQISVLSGRAPAFDFTCVAPDLEHTYLATLLGQNRVAGELQPC